MKTRSSHIFKWFSNRTLLAAVAVGALAAGPAFGSADFWNDSSGNWSAGGNWLSGTTPNPYDNLYFINLSGGTYTPNDDLANGTPFDGIIFTNSTGSFTLGGNSILLSGQTNAANLNIGITNTTSLPETVNNNLALDWGYYTFNSPGGSLNLNGTIGVNTGGVADFGSANLNSTSYTVDSTGLILGLGGAGLTGNTSTGGGPTGLATVSSGAIVPYTFSAAQQVAAGFIGATNATSLTNLELTATTALNYSLAGSTGTTFGAPTNNTYFANIFLSNNTGNHVGIGAVNGGTIVLGTNEGSIYIGGIYLPNVTTAQGVTIGDGTSTYLTCGPMIAGNPVPGEIIIDVAGANTSNEGEMNAVVKDNLGGGAVSVVYTGGGSQYINVNSTYSGGTYLDRARVQCNVTNALGVGPVYVASGDADLSLQNVGNGVMPNHFFISPASSYVGAATEGSMRLQGTGSSGLILSGAITVIGNPVTVSNYGTGTNWPSGAPAVADRISDQSADPTILGGQITGPGTLEFYAGANGMTFWLSNNTVNADNWTGGLVIDGVVNDSSDVKLLANNQLGGNTVTPIASGSGFARLDLNGFSDTIGGLNSISNSVLNDVSDFGTAPSTLTIGANNTSGSFYGTIADNGNANNLSIIKTGSGTQVFGGINTYVGNTFINGGTLTLTNTANINSSAQVAISGGTLNETLLASSIGTNAIFSMTNATWDINVTQYGITNRAVDALNLGGTANTINIASLPLITVYPSAFHLISYSTLSAAITNIQLGSIPVTSPPLAAYVTNENGFVDLVLAGGPPVVYGVTWAGTDPNNPTFWDVATSVNWKTNGVPTVYYNPDFVTFNDSAPGQTTVNVTTTVTPGSVVVSNTVLQYTINGSGSINNNTLGQVSLTKQGTNLLVIDENNGYTGGTFISNGIVQLGAGNGNGTLGSGSVVNNGSLVFDNPGNSQIFGNSISGTGAVTEAGADTLQLAGADTYTGHVLVTNNSVLQLGSYSALAVC